MKRAAIAGLSFLCMASAALAQSSPGPSPAAKTPPIPELPMPPSEAPDPALRPELPSPEKLLPDFQLELGLKQEPDELKGLAYTSTFYLPEDMRQLRAALYNYRLNQARGGPPGDLISDLTGRGPANPPPPSRIEYPQYYLESVVYRGENDWVLWLNGQKILPSAVKESGLIVSEVRKEFVTFTWIPEGLTIDMNRKPANPAQPVQVDAAGEVSFTLFPNQSFSTYTMLITEGYIAPFHIVQLNPAQSKTSGISTEQNTKEDGQIDKKVGLFDLQPLPKPVIVPPVGRELPAVPTFGYGENP